MSISKKTRDFNSLNYAGITPVFRLPPGAFFVILIRPASEPPTQGAFDRGSATRPPGQAGALEKRRRREKPVSPFIDPVRHLEQADVAQRWNVSYRSLERWRWTGQGPRFLNIGGRVVYRLCDIEAYEAEQLRTSTLRTEAGAR